MQSTVRSRILAVLIGLGISVIVLVFGFGIFQGALTRATDTAPRDVAILEKTSTSAKITWTTGQESQSLIRYGTTRNALNFFAPETTRTTAHSVDISLLSPGTTYFFQIEVGEQVYNNNGEPWTFTTNSPANEVIITQTPPPTLGITRFENPRISIPQTTPLPLVTKKVLNSIEVGGQSGVTTAPQACTFSTCQEILTKFDKGCKSSDYIKCVNAATPTP